MLSASQNEWYKRFPFKVFLTLVAVSAFLVAVTLRIPSHQQRFTSIFQLGYLVGPATESLLHHKGLLVCTEGMATPGNPICFKGARMPMASTVLAAGVLLFGDRPAIIESAKAFLCIIPLWAAMGMVLGAVRRQGGDVRISALILILPLLIVNYLIVITGMEIEEGYLFGLIPFALALISCIPDPGPGWMIAAAAALDLIYIAKSSMLLVVFVLLIASFVRLSKLRHRAAICLFVGLAPVSWGVHQYRASGRFSLGTSVDGMNLHVGNNDQFQNRYPISNAYLDTSDAALNKGHCFTDEWSFNDYHMAAGRNFALSHPGYTLKSIEKKAFVMLISINGYTVTPMSGAATLTATLGLVLFRLLLWISLVLAFAATARKRQPGRFFGIVYLAFVAAYCAPYIIGFGFIRHAIVLAYPAAIFCALSLRPSATENPSV